MDVTELSNIYIDTRDEFEKGNYDIISTRECFFTGMGVHLLKLNYNEIPDNKKHETVINLYSLMERNGRRMAKYVKDVKKFRPDDYLRELTPTIKGNDIITIFRCDCGDISKAQNRLSWTLDIDVAKHFYNWHMERKFLGFIPHIYSGKIKAKDIIAYTNDREEQEIIQYRGVKEITEIVQTYV